MIALNAGHEFAFRGERDFADALEASLAPLTNAIAVQLALSHQKCCFGGIPMDRPFAIGGFFHSGIAR